MRAQLSMPGVPPRRDLQFALQDESRMPTMPRRLLERSRRDAGRDVSRFRSCVRLVPGLLGYSDLGHALVRRRSDLSPERDCVRQRAPLLPAHKERMDDAGVSIRRNRTPTPAHNPGRQEIRLTQFWFPFTRDNGYRLGSSGRFRAPRQLLLQMRQPLGSCRYGLIALRERESNL